MKYLYQLLSILLFTISAIEINQVRAQSLCPNSDFSQGSFANWEAYNGSFDNPAENLGIISGRHTLIPAPGTYDPSTCNGLTTVPEGQTYSARLGNQMSGKEAEQLRYSIQVTEESNLFIYKYAVVLEDPGHDPMDQPNFTIEVADQNGQLIDPVCGYYYVYASQGMPTWHSCNEVVWKDWTTVGIDLSPYTGQTISIVFTTRDCALGQHFGYAYISAYCSKLQITFGFCKDDTVATVSAPPGFEYLWDDGNIAQTRIIKNPVMGLHVSCRLTSANGCWVRIDGVFMPTLVYADFNFPPTCMGTPVQFTDSSTINQNQIEQRIWDFGDGSPPLINQLSPEHIFDSLGPYQVRLIAASNDGCPDTITKTVQLVRVPDIHFSIPATCSKKNTSDTLYYDKEVMLSADQWFDHYVWSTGDSVNAIHIESEGWYSLTVNNQNLCYDTDSVNMLECFVELFIPNAFSPNQNGLNDVFRPVTHREKISHFQLIIFNRWGQDIFRTNDIVNGWDGKINGEEADVGVYAYYLSYEIPAGDRIARRGTFTLIR